MRKKFMGILGIAACALMFTAPLAQAQSDVPRFEIGAQYSLLNFNTFACCTKAHRKESGGGGRFTLNFNKYISAEAQLDYFPNSDVERIGTIDVPLRGSKTLIVVGVKAGSRNDRWGVFAKARPGFIHFSSVPAFLCLAMAGSCPQPVKTNFAFDVGGVFEYYPSSKVVVRFDAGDTIIHHKRIFGTTNQFQGSVGDGVRF